MVVMNLRKPAVLAAATAALIGGVAYGAVGAGGASGAGTADTHHHPGSHLGAVLVGGNEVPGPGDADGWGLADVRVKKGEVCWLITVNAVDPITAAHIHAGPAGVAGPIVVPLDPVDRGCTDVDRRTARFIDVHPDQFYVNVHNPAFPAGALRGQLLD